MKWMSEPPKQCDFCKQPITDGFVDGKTVYGPWACMCPTCFFLEGIGIGEGKGQVYELQDNEYIKVAG